MKKILLVCLLMISINILKAQLTMYPSDGKFLSFTTNGGSLTVSRFNIDGTPDLSFGTGGAITTYVSFYSLAFPRIISGEGKIAVLYYLRTEFGYEEVVVLLFNTNGELDTSFGIGGKVRIGLNLGHGINTITNFLILNGEVNVTILRHSPGGASIYTERFPFIRNCPANVLVNNSPGQCGAVVNYSSPSLTQISGLPSGSVFPIGTTTNTFTTNTGTQTTTCSFNVQVEDKENPVITNVSASPNTLWPPNHKMHKVEIKYNLSDNCGTVSSVLTVSSSDDITNDWQVVDPHHVLLRAERSGHSDGRIYIITITATDQYGNVSVQQVQVVVPHDNSKNKRIMGSSASSKTNLIDEGIKELDVSVMSNPSQNYFTLLTRSNSNGLLSIKVVDHLGRTVETKQGIAANGTLQVGNEYGKGIYFIEVVQGNKKKIIKLIKAFK